ncbi:MAG: response regulator transcription factor [Acidobacteriia bacterium]|nr:response regulator transcription factor [Terriglobia bacterium]
MKQDGKVLVNVGMDRLYHEIFASALSLHGWQVKSYQRECPLSSETAAIVLITSLPDAEAVIASSRWARAEFPASKIVLLSNECTDTELVRFIEAGVCACVPGNKGITHLISTLEMLRNNQTVSSGHITQIVVDAIGRLSRREQKITGAPLTERESEILQLVNDGLSNKEIASHLGIAASTVKHHVHRLLEKLKVRSRHEAASMSRRRPPQPSSLFGTS